jgi:DnaJ-class molecular chaperone
MGLLRRILSAKCEDCNGRGWYLLVTYENQRRGTRQTCGACRGRGRRWALGQRRSPDAIRYQRVRNTG